MDVKTIQYLMDTVGQHTRGNPFTYVEGVARGRLLLEAANSNTDGHLDLADIKGLECAYTHQDAILEALKHPVDLVQLERLARAVRALQAILPQVEVDKELTSLLAAAEVHWPVSGTITPGRRVNDYVEAVEHLARNLVESHELALSEDVNAQVHDIDQN